MPNGTGGTCVSSYQCITLIKYAFYKSSPRDNGRPIRRYIRGFVVCVCMYIIYIYNIHTVLSADKHAWAANNESPLNHPNCPPMGFQHKSSIVNTYNIGDTKILYSKGDKIFSNLIVYVRIHCRIHIPKTTLYRYNIIVFFGKCSRKCF